MQIKKVGKSRKNRKSRAHLKACVDILTMKVRKLSDVLGSQVGKIIDFIIRGFLLMLRLRNNGMANKQLYFLSLNTGMIKF